MLSVHPRAITRSVPWTFGKVFDGAIQSLGYVGLLGCVLVGLAEVGTASVCAAEVPRQTVFLNGSPGLVYQATPNPQKPYVAELFSPAGVNLLRDSPVDHKHHHGLMFAVAVDGVNFWEESATSGIQKPTAPPLLSQVKTKEATWQVLRQNLQWHSAQGEALLSEERVLATTRLGQPMATLVNWRSLLRLPPGKSSAQLTGSPYFGLGMRFVVSMDKDGRFFNADGQLGVQGTNNARSAWCAYTAKVDGKPVTVAVFDWPKNVRHPATWFTMDQGFAYLSATLNLHKEPLKLQADRPLELRYGVAVWDGQMESATVEKLYRLWIETACVEGAAGSRPTTPAKP